MTTAEHDVLRQHRHQRFWLRRAELHRHDGELDLALWLGCGTGVGHVSPREGDATVSVERLATVGRTRLGGRVAKERRDREDDDLVRMYLSDIGRYDLLTKDDEARLSQEYEAGIAARAELDGGGITVARKRELRRLVKVGEDAERTFVQANLRLVVSIA